MATDPSRWGLFESRSPERNAHAGLGRRQSRRIEGGETPVSRDNDRELHTNCEMQPDGRHGECAQYDGTSTTRRVSKASRRKACLDTKAQCDVDSSDVKGTPPLTSEESTEAGRGEFANNLLTRIIEGWAPVPTRSPSKSKAGVEPQLATVMQFGDYRRPRGHENP